MNSEFQLDLDQSRKEGFNVALGERVTTGRLLRVSGHAETADALSDQVLQNEYGEIEICGLSGASSLFISTDSLIDSPQLFTGYHIDGIPLLLGVRKACEGHISILGQSRSGKTTLAASLAYQASRLGIPVGIIGCKDLDYMLLGSLNAACGAPTRTDTAGNIVKAPFRFVTMRSNTPTGGFNYFDQDKYELPAWLQAAELLKALGQDGGESDPVRRYYAGAAQALFQRVSWGKSPREFLGNIKKEKLDEEAKRSTSGAVNEVSQIAAIEHLNLPKGHPANIDLADIVHRKGCVYWDPCFMETGSLAIPNAGLAASAFVSAIRKENGGNLSVLMLDEAQKFPINFLCQLIEQAAASKIILIIIFHNLSQIGPHWETVAMTAVKYFFSAVPRSLTEEHLQALFGMHKEHVLSLTDGIGKSTGTSISPTGVTYSTGESENSGFSIQEKETLAWNHNNTLSLNYHRDQFVVIASPGAELAYWGPRAILAQRGGTHMPFDEINRAANEALANTSITMLPGKQQLQLHPPPQLSPEMMAKRTRWAAILDAAASKIRREFIGV